MDEKVEKVLDITVEPAVFKPTGEILFTDTEQLGVKINDIFKPAFEDYDGCRIIVAQLNNGTKAFIPKLYFNILPNEAYSKIMESDDKFTAFVPDDITEKNDIVSRRSRLISYDQPLLNRVHMTKSGEFNLKKILLMKNNNFGGGFFGDVNINNCYRVIRTSETKVYIEVSGLNITTLVNMIYGKEANDGNDYVYQATALDAIGINYAAGYFNSITQQAVCDKYGICILRLNMKLLSESSRMLGYSFNNFGNLFDQDINRMVSSNS